VAVYVDVDVVLTDPMRNSDSSGVDKGGRRSLSVVEGADVNLASPKKAEARHKISVLPLLLSGNEVDIEEQGNATG
jgi:hypothetical protein